MATARARLLSQLAGASSYMPEDSPLFDLALSDEALSILREAGAVSALSEALVFAFHLAWRPLNACSPCAATLRRTTRTRARSYSWIRR